MRKRQCNDPAPLYGGNDCSGEPIEKDSCNVKECPGKISVRKKKTQIEVLKYLYIPIMACVYNYIYTVRHGGARE